MTNDDTKRGELTMFLFDPRFGRSLNPFLEVSTMCRTLNDQLEEFVDDCSLSDVLIALSEVCSLRATDSHDDAARREWQRCSTHVDAVASVAYRVGL
jgi:hypothetical protein